MRIFYTFLLFLFCFQLSLAKSITLTQEEKTWIKKHPKINMVSSVEDVPFDFINDKGVHTGISQDYLNLVSKKTGLKFHLKSTKNWDTMLQMLKNKEADLIPYIYYNKDRAEAFNFTEHYTKVNEHFITRKDEKIILSIEENRDKRFVFIEGDHIIKWFVKKYPNIKFITKPSGFEALQAVSNSQADIYINVRTTAVFIIENSGITNLKINEFVRERGTLKVRMAIRKDYKILSTIISKVINSTTDTQNFKIQTKWRNSKGTRKQIDGAFGYGRAPYMYTQGSNIGLEYTLVDKLLQKSGYELRDIYQVTLNRGQNILDIDNTLEFSVGIIKDDTDDYYYSDPLFMYHNTFITRKNENIILDDLNELKTLKIASWKGFLNHHKKFQENTNIETSNLYKEFSSHKKQIIDFFSKKSDVLILDPLIFRWYERKMRSQYNLEEEKFTYHSLIKEDSPAVVAFRDKPTRDNFNIALKKYEKTEEYERLFDYYNNVDLSIQIKRIKVIAAIVSSFLLENDYKGLEKVLKPFEKSSIIKGIEIIDSSSKTPVLLLEKYNGKFKKVSQSNLDDYPRLTSSIYFQQDNESVRVGNIIIYFSVKKVQDYKHAYFPTIEQFEALEENQLENIKEIYNKYKLQGETLNLTEKEIEWIRNNKIIDIVVDPMWLPNEAFNDRGEYIGIVSDYLKEIELLTDLKFNPIQTSNWNESLELAKSKEIEMVSSPRENKFLKLWYTPSDSYLKNSIAIIMNEKEGYVSSIKLLKDKKIAISKGAANTQEIIEFYPDMNFEYTENTYESLSGVALNKYDAAIVSFNVASYSISVEGFSTLKIVGKLEQSANMSLFVEKQSPILLSIINKALASISQEKEDAIVEKWIQQKYVEKTDYTLVYEIIGLALFLILLFYYWNRKLSREINEKQKAQKALANQLQYQKTLLESMPNPVFTKDINGSFTQCNKSFLNVFGLTNEQIIGKTIHEVKYLDEEKNEAIHNKDLEIINNEQTDISEIKLPFKNGSVHDIIMQRKVFHLADGTLGGLLGVMTDVSELKAIQKELETHNIMIRNSIDYASLIQKTLIPDESILNNQFKDSFTYWKPKDTVGGDIYFVEQLRADNEILIMMIDCTGHGVAGAFVTMLVKALESNIINHLRKSDEEISPSRVLKSFNKKMKILLKQENRDSNSNAGFDAGILYINKNNKTIRFSGAEIPLYYILNNELLMLKGDRHSIGYTSSDIDYEFKEHEIIYENNFKFFLTTDGYIDQNGGEKEFSFGKKKFKNILERTKNLPMNEVKKILIDELSIYQGKHETNDDITIIGCQI